MPQFLWCICSVHLSPSWSSSRGYRGLYLKDRTILPVKDIILLLEFCLKNILFIPRPVLWTGQGCSYGFPISPTVVNIYMEYFEQEALSTAPTPRLWWRYVDDTFVIQKEVYKQDFLQHINSVDPAIHLLWRPPRRMLPSPSWTP